MKDASNIQKLTDMAYCATHTKYEKSVCSAFHFEYARNAQIYTWKIILSIH